MKNLIINFLLLLLLMFTACNKSKTSQDLFSRKHIEFTTTNISLSNHAKFSLFNPKEKFIRQAQLNYQIGDIDSAISSTKKLLNSFGGYILKENENLNSYRIEINLTLKVPSEKFDLFIDSLTQITGDYESKSISLKDVTDKYIDTESRLENKKKLEKKYHQLLKSAKNIEDILAIEKSLGKVREEIESTEKRIMNLNTDINYSTVNVLFYKISSRVPARYKYSMLNQIIDALKRGWYNIIQFILLIISAWPFIILAIICFYIIRKIIKRRRLKNKEISKSEVS